MAETILIDALAGTLPEGFCPTGPGALQQLYDAFVARTQWSLAVGIRFLNFGDTEPTPELRIYPWLRTISGYPDKWYVYVGAAAGPSKWLSRHPLDPGMTIIAPGTVTTPALVDTFGGGEPGAVTLTTGPFWMIDTAFTGRNPIGAGAVPFSDPLVSLNVGDDAGEGSHSQLATEVGSHTHVLTPNLLSQSPGAGAQDGLLFQAPGTGSGDAASPPTISAGLNVTAAAQTKMSLLQPVHARYLIVRTNRLYFRGT